jgi:hypothetical protein
MTNNHYAEARRGRRLADATVIIPRPATLQEAVEALAAAGWTPERAINDAFAVMAIRAEQPADPFAGLTS